MASIFMSDYCRCIYCYLFLAIYCLVSVYSNDNEKIRICPSIKLRDVDYMKELENCTVVEGNLEITLMEFQPHTYPKLREITGYMLLYRVHGLRTLSDVFPNLAVIRGENTFYDFSLVIYEMPDLRNIGLPSLSIIIKGGILLEKNYNLCYINTVDWSRIISLDKSVVYFLNNKEESQCVNKCPEQCTRGISTAGTPQEYCWNSKNCQRNIGCPGHCKYCNNDTKQCCHSFCIGGCSGPTVKDCVACKNVSYENECRESCPNNTYLWNERLCLSKEDCVKKTTSKRGLKNEWYYKTLEMDLPNVGRKNICAQECPQGYTLKGSRCVKCQDRCPKECLGGLVDSIRSAQNYTGCTIINGPIVIKIDGGINIDEKLEKSLGAIEEVTYYIKIVKSYPILSLHFFKNLKVIHGRGPGDFNRKPNKYSLVVIDNPNLQELFPPKISKNLVIKRGKAQFQYNRKLCYSKIQSFLSDVGLVNRTNRDDDNPDLNGDSIPCAVTILNLEVHQVAEREAILRWQKFSLPDQNMLFGYVVYYRKVETKNVDIFQGRDACSRSEWKKFEKDPEINNESPEIIGIMYNLTAWTLYAAYVQPLIVGSAPKTAISNIVYFKTKPLNPSRPTNLKILAKERGELHVQWNPPDEPNGNVTHYLVYWKLQALALTEFYKRDYCSLPLDIEQKTHVYEPRWSEEKTIRNTTLTVDTNCCTCRKPEEEDADKTIVDHPDPHQFEILLRNIVYMKLPQSKVLKNVLKELKELKEAGITKKRKHPLPFSVTDLMNVQVPTRSNQTGAKKQEFYPLADNRSNIVSMAPFPELNYFQPKVPTAKKKNTLPFTLADLMAIPVPSSSKKNKYRDKRTVPKLAHIEDIGNGKSVGRVEDKDFTDYHAVVYDTYIILPNLGNFESYSIKVYACQEPLETGQYLCGDESESAIGSGRTLSSPTADLINSSSIEVNINETGDVLITWEAPADPNGVIISFDVGYKKLGYHEETRVCLSQNKYLENSGVLLEHIKPGNYSFRIRATSLATNGTWTEARYFDIQAPAGAKRPSLFGTYISLTVGSAILLITIVALTVCFLTHSRAKAANMTTVSYNPAYAAICGVYNADEWELARDQVEFVKEIGKGTFGMVWEGVLHNEHDQSDKTRVAIKVMNGNVSWYDRRNFLKEASIMKTFKCHHVVKLLGVVSKGQPALVIMELMVNGDLQRYLRLHRPDAGDENCLPPPTFMEILQIIGEIADGMAYLTDKKFVHRDLAARNCMVAHDNSVKIGDFGMTREIYKTDYYRIGGKGLLPVRWMAPESLKDGIYTNMSDVWSYGIVLWEITTLAAQPYQGLSNEEVLKYVSDGKLLGKPDGCPDKLYDLMLKCWCYRDRHRPTFKQIIEMLAPDLNPNFEQVSYFFSDENKPNGPEFHDIEEHDRDMEDQSDLQNESTV